MQTQAGCCRTFASKHQAGPANGSTAGAGSSCPAQVRTWISCASSRSWRRFITSSRRCRRECGKVDMACHAIWGSKLCCGCNPAHRCSKNDAARAAELSHHPAQQLRSPPPSPPGPPHPPPRRWRAWRRPPAVGGVHRGSRMCRSQQPLPVPAAPSRHGVPARPPPHLGAAAGAVLQAAPLLDQRLQALLPLGLLKLEGQLRQLLVAALLRRAGQTWMRLQGGLGQQACGRQLPRRSRACTAAGSHLTAPCPAAAHLAQEEVEGAVRQRGGVDAQAQARLHRARRGGLARRSRHARLHRAVRHIQDGDLGPPAGGGGIAQPLQVGQPAAAGDEGAVGGWSGAGGAPAPSGASCAAAESWSAATAHL